MRESTTTLDPASTAFQARPERETRARGEEERKRKMQINMHARLACRLRDSRGVGGNDVIKGLVGRSRGNGNPFAAVEGRLHSARVARRAFTYSEFYRNCGTKTPRGPPPPKQCWGKYLVKIGNRNRYFQSAEKRLKRFNRNIYLKGVSVKNTI